MINISNLSIQYGGQFLFDDISFSITEKDRIGLVGKNGAGKSSLLKVILGEIKPEPSTQILIDGGTTIGYLPQELKLNPTQSVFEETAKAFDEIQLLEKQITDLNHEISETTNFESEEYYKMLTLLGDSQERFNFLGGTRIRENCERILKGLGFKQIDFDRPLKEFSGGWQMRVELAKILLRKPTFILLDEPTNHLDIESIIWLEDFLKIYEGGIALISHDKAFMDKVCNRTIELVAGKMYDYRGVSYSQYSELRKERIEKQKVEKRRQEDFIEHTQDLINKFRAKKNKAAFAQTLITKLDKLEKVELDDLETAKIKFRFPEAPRSGREVVKVNNLSKNYNELNVLNKITFTIERGEKIAFVGKNGEGKTTLGKIIANKLSYEGTCELGHNVSIGYFEQHQAESLDGNQTVLQVIDDAATGEMRLKVRALLGAFLFTGDNVDKKVAVLSGGEKSRLALAKLLLNPVNLLILDEPTNHLDMQAKDMLKIALQNFEGTLIVVSHDREFLKGLTTKVFEFNNQKIKEHFGDIYDFLQSKQIDTLDELTLQAKSKALNISAANKYELYDEKTLKEMVRNLEKTLKTLSNKISKVERKITDLELEQETLENTMANPDFYTLHANPNSILQKYELTKSELDTEMKLWETLQQEQEGMQQELKALELKA